jgi:hypothetical protein
VERWKAEDLGMDLEAVQVNGFYRTCLRIAKVAQSADKQ